MIQPRPINNLDSVSLILIWRCVKINYPAHAGILLALNAIECRPISRKTKGVAHTSYCRVSGDYRFLIDSGCAVVCMQSKSRKKH